MSYEEDYRKPYKAKCACGNGFLRFYKVHLSNDWGQEQEYDTTVELVCDCCKEKYHYESNRGSSFLVPNGLEFPKQEPKLEQKYAYTEQEAFICKYNKQIIKDMLADMTAPKHRFIKNLRNKSALEFAEEWVRKHNRRSLEPMISYLRNILDKYEDLKESYEYKKPYVDHYYEECDKKQILQNEIEKQSIPLSFYYDVEQDQIDTEKAQKEHEKYEEEHRYDSFQATVCYDQSFKKDLTNCYWDSYFIEKCTDQEYLSLDKPQYGPAKVIIAKKYLCKCTICGKRTEIVSSDFKISYEDERGYYPLACCDCHTVSSFEAKTMDILNQLGVTYIREYTFEDLKGDYGKLLRFDFALYKSYDESGAPIIDLLIELQGPHHYKRGYYDEFGDYITDDDNQKLYGSVEDNFIRQCSYDERKKQYCEQHNINLECVKYTIANDYERLEKRIIKILKNYGYTYYIRT